MRSTGALILILTLAGCALDPGARPQVVLYVDTDVPVPSLADTLRVEVLDSDLTVSEARTYVLPNVTDWPVSFGIAPRPDGAATVVRLRLYEASRIASRNPSEYTAGLAPDDPLPAFVIDRLVEVTPPASGLEYALVVLHGECMGVDADLGAAHTCIATGLEPRGPAQDGVTVLDEPPSAGAPPRAGTWDAGRETPCVGSPRADTGLHDEEVCIPGGVFFMGDGRLGVNAGVGSAWASIPERLVRISPFFMDRHEVTVGRINAAVRDGFVLPADEHVTKARMSLCTLVSDGTTDDLPMNCLSKELAEAFCAFDGGRALPSEAQWEFAASGRGEERLYVWGDRPATCDDAIFARIGMSMSGVFGIDWDEALGRPGQCADLGEGLQPVGAFPADVTKDGVVGLSGNLQEWTRDSFIALNHECWDKPHLTDPVCDTGQTGDSAYITRGGIWSGVLGSLPVSLRKSSKRDTARGADPTSFTGFATGFRCVRPGT